MSREFSPMKCQVPNGDKIICRDCIHRDHTVIQVGDVVYAVGVTKGNCDMFVYPDSKPSSILFQNADCEFYEEE